MSGSVRVVSRRKGGVAAAPGETVIDGDRTNAALGNPFALHDHLDDAARAACISKYNAMVTRDMVRRGPIFRAIDDLARRVAAGESIALRCWCAPRPCHLDRIAELITTEVQKMTEESIE